MKSIPRSLTEDMDGQIDHIRSEFADRLWKGLLCVAAVAVPLSISRSSFTGWLPIYTLHLCQGLIILGMVLALKKLSTSFKSGFLLVFLWMVGLPGLLTFGLAAPSTWWLVLSCLAASTLYSPRAGIAVALLSALVFILAGYGFITGHLRASIDTNTYLTQPTAWATMLVSTSAFMITLLIAVSAYNRAVTTALELRMHELERSKKEAEAASLAKSDFLANMSHEIRTPLNAVLGMAHLLGNSQLNDDQSRYLDMIKNSGQTLLSILNDILDFSKIEAGRMDLEPTTFALGDVLGSVANMMSVNAAEKDLELGINVEGDVPQSLIGDALRLQQVLTNLVSNAIKFTSQGEVTLQVELVTPEIPVNEHEVHLRFLVTDSGIGMSEEQIERLFSAFAQADSSVTRRYGGTGLGLAICKRLVEMMHGTIAVKSVAGQGSQFSVCLPFTRSAIEVTNNLPRNLGSLRLLLVDDNKNNCRNLATTMQAWGWQVDSAETGQQALALLADTEKSNKTYDALLLDWQMPGMNGLALLEQIRQNAAKHQYTPAILMSNAQERNKLNLTENKEDVAALLIKPITAARLFQTVQQTLTPSASINSFPITPSKRIAGARLLLVEDNPLNQIVASGMLENEGAQITIAENGQLALDLLAADANRFDMVLMDVQMPVMDGITATHKIRQELKLDIPIVAMTASVLTQERERCKTSGMNDFIAKPIVVEQLFSTITPFLRNLQPAPEAPKPAPRIFDLGELADLKADDPEYRTMLCSLVKSMASRAPIQLDEALLAWQDGRIEDAARTLHTMRGSIGTLGALDFAEKSRELELALVALETGRIDGLFASTREQLTLTVNAANAWLAEQEAGG